MAVERPLWPQWSENQVGDGRLWPLSALIVSHIAGSLRDALECLDEDDVDGARDVIQRLMAWIDQ